MMIGKLLTPATNSDESVSLKDSLTEDGNSEKGASTSSAPMFQSLLQALQAGNNAQQQNLMEISSDGEEGESKEIKSELATLLGSKLSLSETSSTDGKTKQSTKKDLLAKLQHLLGDFSEGDLLAKVKKLQETGEESQVTGGNLTANGENTLDTDVEEQKGNPEKDQKANSSIGELKTDAAGKDILESGKNTGEGKKENIKTGPSSELLASDKEKAKTSTIPSGNQQEEKSNISNHVLKAENSGNGASNVSSQQEQANLSAVVKGESKPVTNEAEAADSENVNNQQGGKPESLGFDIAVNDKNRISNPSTEVLKNEQQKSALSDSDESAVDKIIKDKINNSNAADEKSAFSSVMRKEGRTVQSVLSPKGSQADPQKEDTNSFTNRKNNLATEPQSAKAEVTENQKKMIDNFFQKNTAGGISEKGFEMKSSQVDKLRKKSDEADSKKAGRNGDKSESPSLFNSRSDSSPVRNRPIPAGNIPEASDNLDFTFEEKISWEQNTAESAETLEEKGNSKKATMKLGQIPITNSSLRKKILPGLTKNVVQAASEARKNPENWQKHNFVLDDGKNIQLSVREAKGVIQVKMGSMNMDLSKLLQQNLQQIREHLKQDFGSEVDLQFENHEQEDSSQFSENSDSAKSKRNAHNSLMNKGFTSENTERTNVKAVRNFGYNQMEWTA